MQFKQTLTVLVAVCAFQTTFAQDYIYTRDGGMYEVKIREVGTQTITYKKWSNPEGPDFVLARNLVERIKFQNGEEEHFKNSDRLPSSRSHKAGNKYYGKNILSLSPIHMTNISPIGFGMSYERVLDKKNIVSFYLPVAYSFRDESYNYYSNPYYYRNDRKMVWAYPGVKIYPTGSDGVVRYGVGPSLAIGGGGFKYTETTYDPFTGQQQYHEVEDNIFALGLIVNNSLNIQPTPKLHLGLEMGIGVPYYTNERRAGNYYYNVLRDAPLVQFNLQFGYRF